MRRPRITTCSQRNSITGISRLLTQGHMTSQDLLRPRVHDQVNMMLQDHVTINSNLMPFLHVSRIITISSSTTHVTHVNQQNQCTMMVRCNLHTQMSCTTRANHRRRPRVRITPTRIITPYRVNIKRCKARLSRVLNLHLIIRRSITIRVLVSVTIQITTRINTQVSITRQTTLTRGRTSIARTSRIRITSQDSLTHIKISRLFTRLRSLITISTNHRITIP